MSFEGSASAYCSREAFVEIGTECSPGRKGPEYALGRLRRVFRTTLFTEFSPVLVYHIRQAPTWPGRGYLEQTLMLVRTVIRVFFVYHESCRIIFSHVTEIDTSGSRTPAVRKWD